jgi:hypothetical protein
MKVYTPYKISRMKRLGYWTHGLVQVRPKVFILAEIFPGYGFVEVPSFTSAKEAEVAFKAALGKKKK